MRRDVLGVGFAVSAFGFAGLLGGGSLLDVGGAVGRPTSSDRAALLATVRKGQLAILRDRPAAVCRLLTRRARRNSLLSISLDHDRDGRLRPKPKTCVQAIGYQIDDARAAGDLRRLRTERGLRRTRIVRIQGNRAHVRKVRPDGPIEIYLLKRRDGWRADFATFSPFDGTSGE